MKIANPKMFQANGEKTKNKIVAIPTLSLILPWQKYKVMKWQMSV